jgi:hypothetical protein
MTAQQQQQVQQLIQSMPQEKVAVLQQQAQQMVAQQQQFQQPIIPQQPMNPQQQQQPQRPAYTTTAPSGLFGSKQSSGHSSTPTGPKDEKQTGKVQRFMGDTLFGRVGRASVQTVTSAIKMPASLSPWGDNNPVTLPNVRYRDAILFTTFAFVGAPLVDGISDGVTGAFGADSFISEIVSSGAGAIVGSTILKYSVFQIVEQAIDKGILEHMLPEEEKMLTTTSVKSLQVGVKHKLMGVDADLRFVGVYPARDTGACDKGWFCPYLFASARTPQIPRSNDFAVCQFFGPFLGGEIISFISFPHPYSIFHLLSVPPPILRFLFLCMESCNDLMLSQTNRRLPPRPQTPLRIRPRPLPLRPPPHHRHRHKPHAHPLHRHLALPRRMVAIASSRLRNHNLPPVGRMSRPGYPGNE